MRKKKTGWMNTKRVLLISCALCFVGLFAYALAYPAHSGLTEVSAVTVIETPVPVLILPTTPPSATTPAPEEMCKLDLNQADAWMLCAVPGIGEETAKRIIAYRDLVGGFTDVMELKRVPGIGDGTYERALPYLDCGE